MIEKELDDAILAAGEKSNADENSLMFTAMSSAPTATKRRV